MDLEGVFSVFLEVHGAGVTVVMMVVVVVVVCVCEGRKDSEVSRTVNLLFLVCLCL